MSIRKFVKKYLFCLILVASLFPILSIVLISNRGFSETANATLSASSSHSNPYKLHNGEDVTIQIKWSKRVVGFGIEDMAFNLVDRNGSSITGEIADNPRIDLPGFSNFRKVNPDTYRVKLTAPYNFGPKIVAGEMIVSFARKDDSVIGEDFTNNVLRFEWGKKASAFFSPRNLRLKNGQIGRVMLDFDRNVKAVNARDFSIDSGRIFDVWGFGPFMEMRVQAPRRGSGSMKLRLREDACAEGNNKVLYFISYGPEN